MNKVGIVTLSIFRILFGLLILAYSIWLLGGFFFAEISNFINFLRQNYKFSEFILVDIPSLPQFLFLSLLLGSIYLISAISMIILKQKARIGATYLLFSVWVFIIFLALMNLKEGIKVGFNSPDFKASIDNLFIIARLSITAIVSLPFLAGGEPEN